MGDSVNFTDTGIAQNTVTVDAGGVSAGVVSVSNTAGTYTVTGGPIASGLPLQKSEAGALVLGASFSNGLNVTAGTVTTAADEVLGDTAAVTLGDETTLDLDGHNETIGALNLTGATVSTGTGLLTVTGAMSISYSLSATPVTISGHLSTGTTAKTLLLDGDLNLDADLTGTGRISFQGVGTVPSRATIRLSAVAFGSSPDPLSGSSKTRRRLAPLSCISTAARSPAGIELTGADKIPNAVSLGGGAEFAGEDWNSAARSPSSAPRLSPSSSPTARPSPSPGRSPARRTRT